MSGTPTKWGKCLYLMSVGVQVSIIHFSIIDMRRKKIICPSQGYNEMELFMAK